MKNMTRLFVDSENFKKKIKSILKAEGKQTPLWHEYGFSGLLDRVFAKEQVDKKAFYSARIKIYEETPEKSQELVEEQRLLKLALEKSGIEFIFAGKVMGNPISEGNTHLVFREKGVDVRLAVDMVEMAYRGLLDTAIIGSSDSDLQPAITALKRKGVKCIYLGFENRLNKGLLYTCSHPIIIKESDVLEFLPREPAILL